MFNQLRVVVLVATLAAPTVSRADGFSSLEESLIRLVGMAGILQLADFDFDGTGCLFGYLLDEGAERGMTREFQAGRNYVILGAGDDDVIDADMWITPVNEPGQSLAEDFEVDPTPILEFRPARTGQYTINIRNFRSRGPGFCCFVILAERPGALPSGLMPLAEALDNAIDLARLRGFFAQEFPSNNLVLFGGKFDREQSSYTYDLSYPRGDYVVVASGSKSIIDVDLYVDQQHRHTERAGVRVAKFNDVTNLASCNFPVQQGRYYCIEMENYESRGSGFIFGFVLRDRDN